MKVLFRENFKVNEQEAKTNVTKLSWKQRCKKWDRSFASMFGLIAFFTLVGIVIFNIFQTSRCGDCNKTSCKNNTKHLKQGDRSAKFESKCTLDNSNIKCSYITEGNEQLVADHINKLFEKDDPPSLINQLTIEYTNFKEDELKYQWLNSIKPKVQILMLVHCPLTKINERAFADHPFTHLTTLRIASANLETLTPHSFLGLTTTLTSFAYANYGSIQKLNIEEEFLKGMSSLTDFELSNYMLNAKDIINLFGEKGTLMSGLETIVFTGDKIQELEASSFMNTPKVKALHFQSAGLRKIHPQAFWKATKIELLNLTDNVLETLEEGTFRHLNIKNPGRIALSNNRWNCNCSLQWLKDYYSENNWIDKERPPLCFGVGTQFGKKFEEVEFCPNIFSSSDSPAPSSTIQVTEGTTSSSSACSPETPSTLSPALSKTSTTPPPPKYTTIKCRDQSVSPSWPPKNAKVSYVHTVKVVIRDESVTLKFQELDLEPLTIILKTNEDLSNYHLLWFNTDDKTDSGCHTALTDNMVLDDLKRGTTYTLSLLEKNKSEVSPKGTFGIKTEPVWHLRAWITNKYQSEVITLTVVVSVLVICLTAFLTFLCIRRYPKVIASNKSVIIVKPKKNSEEATPTREYERPAYWEPAYLVPSSQGYLTPKFHRYAKVRYRPPLMRSISEWSLTSTNNQAIYDDPRHLRASRLLRRQNQNEIFEPDGYCDYRPPLPPPNPGGRRSVLVPEEDIYSAV